MIVYYQLAISHYCEKIRWALEHKRIHHRTVTLLPGLHALKMRRMGLETSLPVVDHDGTLVQGSSHIIDHLDDAFPDHSLTPADPGLAAEAEKWEAVADEEIGPHVRRICYHHFLQHPAALVPMMAHGGPWYGRFLLRAAFRGIERQMRDKMEIHASGVEASIRTLDAAIQKITERRQGRRFLVGETFTRADLAAAALLSPLRMSADYGIPWPADLPPAVAAVVDRYADRLAWVDDMYACRRERRAAAPHTSA